MFVVCILLEAMTSNPGTFYVHLFRPVLWSYFKDFQILKRFQFYIFWGFFFGTCCSKFEFKEGHY